MQRITTHLTVSNNWTRTGAERCFLCGFPIKISAFIRVFPRPIPKCQVASITAQCWRHRISSLIPSPSPFRGGLGRGNAYQVEQHCAVKLVTFYVLLIPSAARSRAYCRPPAPGRRGYPLPPARRWLCRCGYRSGRHGAGR